MTITIDQRRRPKDLDKDLLKGAIRMIKRNFAVSWLEDETFPDHPLKVLWRHTDVLATDQLFQLGHSLKKIKSINKDWYNQAINEIKNSDISKIHANILEIFVASQLHNPPDRIVELPNSAINPGYDLIVKLSNNFEMYIQVKNNSRIENFRISEQNQEVERIVASNLNGKVLKVFISKADNNDPNEVDWHHLKERLSIIMQGTIDERGIMQDIDGGWHIEAYDIGNSINYLHPSKPSYEILLVTPFSKLEKNNIFEKISKACSDLKNKREVDTERSVNIALVCIPLDAPFAMCGDLVHQYFDDSPEPRASGVLFYKSGVTMDTNKNQSFLAHAFYLVLRKDKLEWFKTNGYPFFKKIDIAIGRGVFSIDGFDEKDIYNLIDARIVKTELKNSHPYQTGQMNYLLKELGQYKFDKHPGIKLNIFFKDGNRIEKEVTKDYFGDDTLLLL